MVLDCMSLYYIACCINAQFLCVGESFVAVVKAWRMHYVLVVKVLNLERFLYIEKVTQESRSASHL